MVTRSLLPLTSCALRLAVVGLVLFLRPWESRAQAVLTPYVGESLPEYETRLDLARRKEPAVILPRRVQNDMTLLPGSDGQYVISLQVDSLPVTMLIDTGASVVALAYDDAARLGLKPEAMNFWRTMQTANGTITAAPVVLRAVSIGDIVVPNVEAVVLPPGSLTRSLLGMSFLSRLKSMELVKGRLSIRG